MTIDRRKLFALGGLGAIAAGTGNNGPEVLPQDAGAITVKMRYSYEGWQVLVPDWDYTSYVGRLTIAVKWMPLEDFLKQLEQLNEQKV